MLVVRWDDILEKVNFSIQVMGAKLKGICDQLK